ncbi:glycosyltransferase family 2 protein [uncultured Mucilaginibacter sp.]|uniref:glycosyltransferase family 2 protein n=1 Tax=uncultured Mucilaginibacter sp. TaxID=797541 RepID=UPI002615665F|nr:glycosyltransferase family 2 protein [uncultured Mucilaginibacter sp.]
MQLSIITINYNNASGLEQTFKSIENQSYKHYEYIVIDGGSTDGSLNIIKEYEHLLNYWISEKDTGIYNAINKGIHIAKGKYLFFLNSGDLLHDNQVLDTIIPDLNNEDIVYGNLLIKELNRSWLKIYPSKLLFSYFLNDSLPHSGGIFILKSAFKNELRIYDESLKIVSDWKWFMLALFKYNYSYKYLDKTIGIFDFTGISARPENSKLLLSEKKQVLEKYFPRFYPEIANLTSYKNELYMLKSSRYFKLYMKLKTLF